MKFLRLFVVSAALALSSSAFAQDIDFGVKAGMNISNFSEKYGGSKVNDNKSKIGISLGAFADYSLTDMFAIEAGLQFDQVGSKFEWSEDDESEKITTNVNYLTIPINFRANLAVGDNKLYFLAGPTIGLGLSGKEKAEYTEDGKTNKTDDALKFGSGDEDNMKRMNLGFLLGAGFEMTNNIGFRLTYDIGLSNLLPKGDGDNSLKTGCLGLSVTYKF
ncbi:MAG: PorT family protein [Bacteroidales bacterium]|nr:PorT family protein [Bacteroidales bacterium]